MEKNEEAMSDEHPPKWFIMFPLGTFENCLREKNESMWAYLLIFATKQKDLQFASLLVKIPCLIFFQ